jgi:hypothetical protein
MTGGEEVAGRNQLLTEIADCLDEAVRLQSRITELTEQAHQAAGMSSSDRTLRAKVTGLFFGVQSHLEGLSRMVREET